VWRSWGKAGDFALGADLGCWGHDDVDDYMGVEKPSWIVEKKIE
jgi:hypothetical protein